MISGFSGIIFNPKLISEIRKKRIIKSDWISANKELPAIFLASSFQRRQPHPVSITLAPTNSRRTFASTKFLRTSGELFRRNRALPVQMDTTQEFPSSSSTPWCAQSRESDVASVIFPNSGELFRRHRYPWPKVSTPSRSSRRFLSLLPFPCTFGGRPHRISISLPFFVLLQYRAALRLCRPPSLSPPIPAISATPCRRWGSPRIPLHLLPPFCTSSDPRPPPPPATRTTGALVRLLLGRR
jgi:hypothetical protein